MEAFREALELIEMPAMNEADFNTFADILQEGLEFVEDAEALQDLQGTLVRWVDPQGLNPQQRQQNRNFWNRLARRALTEMRNLVGLNNPPEPLPLRINNPPWIEDDFEEEEGGFDQAEEQAEILRDEERRRQEQLENPHDRLPSPRLASQASDPRSVAITTPRNLDSSRSMSSRDDDEFAPGPRPAVEPRGRGKRTIRMPYDEFVAEHKHLLHVLDKGDRKTLREEYKKQKEELGRHGRF